MFGKSGNITQNGKVEVEENVEPSKHNIANKELKTLYRGERSSTVPDNVFKFGFSPKGKHNDPLLHTKSNATAGNFISTTSERAIAECFAGKHGYVYEIKTNNYIDINSTYGNSVYFPEQMEFSIPGGISPSEIIGAYPMNNGKISGSFIKNQFYGGK